MLDCRWGWELGVAIDCYRGNVFYSLAVSRGPSQDCMVCGVLVVHTHTKTHTHTQTEKAESLKASLSVFRGDYACITLHAPLATLIQCWTFSFHTFFHLFDSISQLFSPKSPLFPLLHHFNTFFFRLCLLFSRASLTSLTAVQFVHLCYEVASRSFSATLQ